MNARELFNSIMFYGDFDRVPAYHWAAWSETMVRWESEGIPAGADVCALLEADRMPPQVPIEGWLYPKFEEQTMEETEEYRIFRQADGVVAQHWKHRSCIPHYVDFTLKDRKSWEPFRERLQPDPGRIPKDLDATIAKLAASGQPLSVSTGSMAGWIRDWMGVLGFAYLQQDDPELVGEMVDTISDLICWCIDQALPKIRVDMGWGWEDICGRNGPLVTPSLFDKYMVPGYRKISNRLLDYGVRLHVVDCDGLIDALVPLWLKAGVNVMFPIEIGAWNADPMAFRKKYGKELRVIGGIDKLAIPKGPKAIDEEINRRLPLMREGGFIPLPDHFITPDASVENYRYYLRKIRELRF